MEEEKKQDQPEEEKQEKQKKKRSPASTAEIAAYRRRRRKWWLFAIISAIVVGVVLFLVFTSWGLYLIDRARTVYITFGIDAADFEADWSPPDLPEPTTPGERAASALVPNLASVDPTGQTVSKFAEIGEAAVPYLVNALKRGNVPTRYQAAAALGMIGDKAAFKGLVATLLDDEKVVRAAAALALADLGDRRAIPFLAKCLTMQSRRVRFAAACALQRFDITIGRVVFTDLAGDPDYGKEAKQKLAGLKEGKPEKDKFYRQGEPLPVIIRLPEQQ
ncbi:MAG: HEAT repeat domain-containing protein [Planctomycetota bacterium]|nr:MAG: HEAT repeat domain-containing protein [Planctomycetota bacterium]